MHPIIFLICGITLYCILLIYLTIMNTEVVSTLLTGNTESTKSVL